MTRFAAMKAKYDAQKAVLDGMMAGGVDGVMRDLECKHTLAMSAKDDAHRAELEKMEAARKKLADELDAMRLSKVVVYFVLYVHLC